jgi:hypothetical protein
VVSDYLCDNFLQPGQEEEGQVKNHCCQIPCEVSTRSVCAGKMPTLPSAVAYQHPGRSTLRTHFVLLPMLSIVRIKSFND